MINDKIYGAVQVAIQYHLLSVESHSNQIHSFLLIIVVVGSVAAQLANCVPYVNARAVQLSLIRTIRFWQLVGVQDGLLNSNAHA